MASVLKVDKLDPQSGTALEIGTSGDTITVPSGATFNVAGTLQEGGSALVTGKVLQVVQAVSSSQFSTSSIDEVDVTGMAITITPSATSSKILLWFQCGTEVNGSCGGLTITLYRGGTPIKENAQYSYPSVDGWNAGIAGFNYLYMDSPSTTSATTYKIAQESEVAGTMYWNYGTTSNGMTVIAQEIEG